MYEMICSDQKCTACFACFAICNKDAISEMVNEYGYTYLRIDNRFCISCGRCKEVCPQISSLDLNKPQQCIAAQTIEERDREFSSSGGIGACLSKKMVLSGGVVFGCSSEGGIAKHVCASDLDAIEAFSGSKYVQSDMKTAVKDITEKLKKGKKTLFIGTPCQVAGVKAVNRKYSEYLYCVDFVCHGVPPMTYLSQHFSSLLKDKRVNKFSFRGKDKDFHLKIFSDDKLVYCKNRDADEYYYAFMNKLSYRESCYNCIYAQEKRIGDLTIADFWGLDRKKLHTNQKGRISAILINNEKGKLLWNMIKNDVIWEERDIKEAVIGNDQLREASRPHSCRQRFLLQYLKYQNFNRAFHTSGIKKEWEYARIKRTKLARGAKKIIKRIILSKK